MMELYDCIVIGAGYAGLAAAKRLKESGARVLLLEARDRVGGRAWTRYYPDGTYEDYGASYLAVKQSTMQALAREFGIDVFDAPTKGSSLQYYRGVVKRYSNSLIPPLNPLALRDAWRVLRRLEKLALVVNLVEPWNTPGAKRYDRTTVAEWLQATCWTRSGLDLANMTIEVIFGQNPSQVSLLHAMWYIKGAISLTVVCSIENGAQQQLIKGGGQAIANSIQGILGDVVHLEEPVVAIDQTDSSQGVTVQTVKGEYVTRRVIVAIPPLQLLKISFAPALPLQRTSLLQRMPMGAYWKVFATYETPFWRRGGLRGEVISPDGYISLTNDVSPEDRSRGVLMGFVVGSKAYEFAEICEEERRKISVSNFIACFGSQAANPLRLTIHTMMNEEWSGGCPAAVPIPGMWSSLGSWLRKPVDRVHWAGSELATSWSGYMEGAAQSGMHAAEEVIKELGG